MMMKKMPVASMSISARDVLSFTRDPQDKLAARLSGLIGSSRTFFLSSGLACFYVILEALKKAGAKKEVILPAFTASSLVVAIRKAGLKPVLCDVSLRDLNMDAIALERAVSKDTLAIIGIHMYGIPMEGLPEIKRRFPGVYVIEDCAQSFGSSVAGRLVGSSGDAGFFSFNKGKNTPSCGGGAIVTNDKEIARNIGEVMACVKESGVLVKALLPIKAAAISIVVNPAIYGLFYRLISLFKDTAPPTDVRVEKYTPYQAALELMVLDKLDNIVTARYENGMRLMDGLKGLEGVKLPEIPHYVKPAFNRFPILFKDLAQREAVKRALWDSGIEANELYLMPVHHQFDLGYGQDDFPNAVSVSRRLLTLPVHTMVRAGDVDRMVTVIKKSV